jgi:RNA polymerase sigma-70 factor (ECF subfamily)
LTEQGPTEPVVPRDAMADRELTLDINQALGTLPDDQRVAIVMVDVEGYSVADAATALGVAEGTIKSRCARGRAKLAVQLGHLRNRSGPGSVQPLGAPSTTAPVHGGPAPGRGPATGRGGG